MTISFERLSFCFICVIIFLIIACAPVKRKKGGEYMKIKIIALVLSLLILCGCDMYSESSILQHPELPEQYGDLLDAITSITSKGYEYTEPVSGLNRQSLQIMDLDGDGIDEGIALMRDTANSYKTFIYIFRQVDDSFELLDVIEGKRGGIYTVSFSNILSRGNIELLVEWGDANSEVRDITAYSLSGGKAETVLDTKGIQYSVSDIDQNGINDLCIITKNGAKRTAEIYIPSLGKMQKISELPLADGSGKVLQMTTGNATPDSGGVFIECENGSGVITSIIVYENGEFINAVPKGISCDVKVFCEDVNGDGITETPIAALSTEAKGEVNRCYDWCVYEGAGNIRRAAFTYHSFVENWYMSMPLSWSGAVTAERNTTRPGQVSVLFSAKEELPIMQDIEVSAANTERALFSVYILTGAQRKTLAAQDGRVVLYENEDTSFVAEIHSDAFKGEIIDEEFVKNSFKIRKSDWISNVLLG